MYNEKSLKNLQKFSSENQPKKKGRPKGSVSITNEIKKILKSKDENSRKSVAEILAAQILRQAMKGNPVCIKEIFERIDGKVPNKTENVVKDGGPVTMTIVYDDAEKKNDLDWPLEKNKNEKT
jgi:hypothetical protein